MGYFKDIVCTGIIRCLSKIYASEFVGKLTGVADSAKTLNGLTSTVSELNYVDGVTSNVQTQLDNKFPINGRIETLTNFATQCNKTGKWSISNITSEYANSIGLSNNCGDFYYFCIDFNPGNNGYAYGFLVSPRFKNDEFYIIKTWEGTTTARRIHNDVMDIYGSGVDPYENAYDELVNHGFTHSMDPNNDFAAMQATDHASNTSVRCQINSDGCLIMHRYNHNTGAWSWVKTLSPGSGYSCPTTIQEAAPGDSVVLWAW